MESIEKKELRHQIEVVKLWLESEGISVISSRARENEYLPKEKSIIINLRQNVRSRLHALLHEAGHFILRKDEERHNNRFPNLLKPSTNRDSRIDSLREEVLAWERGLDLANQLDIEISMFWWSRHIQQSLLTYINWVVNPRKE